MPAPEITEERKHDLEVLSMRKVLDPKRFYKAADTKGPPKYFQVSILYSKKGKHNITGLSIHFINSFPSWKFFMLFYRLLIFFQNSFRNTISVSNRLDPDQARSFVGPDLGPNCLQRLSADDTQ